MKVPKVCNDLLIDIETTLAYHEQQVEQMNEVITEQWKEIEALKRQLSYAVDKIEQLYHDSNDGKGGGGSILEQATCNRPPHY